MVNENSDKLNLIKKLNYRSFISEQDTVGIELEFQVSREEANNFQKNKFNNYFTYYNDSFYTSIDHANLIEFKSYPILLNDFNYDIHVREFINKCKDFMKKNFSNNEWYGIHFSVFKGYKNIENIPKYLSPLEQFNENSNYLKLSFNENFISRNIYIYDKFSNVNTNLCIYILTDEEKYFENKRYILDWDSCQRAIWFINNIDDIDYRTNYLPVPGFSIRICNRYRLELLLTTLSNDNIKYLSNLLMKSSQIYFKEKQTINIKDYNYYCLFSTKGRFAITFLKQSYKNEPRKCEYKNHFFIEL